jgi:hypothetical protein
LSTVRRRVIDKIRGVVLDKIAHDLTELLLGETGRRQFVPQLGGLRLLSVDAQQVSAGAGDIDDAAVRPKQRKQSTAHAQQSEKVAPQRVHSLLAKRFGRFVLKIIK